MRRQHTNQAAASRGGPNRDWKQVQNAVFQSGFESCNKRCKLRVRG